MFSHDWTRDDLQRAGITGHRGNVTKGIHYNEAYTWAKLPPGEELYLVLERNLYGMPSAARGWGKCRDSFILSRFNQQGWKCHRSLMDPCLFIIDRYSDDGGEPQLMRQETSRAAEYARCSSIVGTYPH